MGGDEEQAWLKGERFGFDKQESMIVKDGQSLPNVRYADGY